MKKLIFISILFFVACIPQKKSIIGPKVVLTTNDSVSVVELDKTVMVESTGEGIGLGSLGTIGTIGHGVGHMMVNQPKQHIIYMDKTKTSISSTSTNMGHVAYKIPTEMKVRNTYQVIVRISKTTATIFENLDGEIRTATIPVTETMEVKLIDPSPEDRKMFEVIADNDPTQLVENNESVTQWSWDVTPIRSGQAHLKVMIAIITNGNRKETVYQDTVNIETNLGKQIPFFFGKYWQWLLSTLIIPFGVWFYNRKKKKEGEEEKPRKKRTNRRK
jgi:hypothetical protein